MDKSMYERIEATIKEVTRLQDELQETTELLNKTTESLRQSNIVNEQLIDMINKSVPRGTLK